MEKEKSKKSGRCLGGILTGGVLILVITLLIAVPISADDSLSVNTPIAGAQEIEIVDVFQTSAAPPTFIAFPSAADFFVTGAEGGYGSEHYFPSNGDGTFGARSTIPSLNYVDGMDVADMDGDGDNDILIGDGVTAEIYLYTNDGAGNFTTAVIATGVSSGGYCTNLRVGDFNEDGWIDFVVGDNRVTNGMFVYLQTSPGTFTKAGPTLDIATWSSVGGNSLFGVAVGDVDGDGHQDILVLGYNGIGAGQMRFYKGDGTGGMASSTVLFNIGNDFGVGGTVGLALFDLEGDGDIDIIAGGGSGGTHFIYTNDGTGNFTKPTGSVFDVDAQTGLDAFDFDGDGDHDLVVAASSSKAFYVENLGGSLANPVLVSSSTGFGIGIGAPYEAFVSEPGIEKSFKDTTLFETLLGQQAVLDNVVVSGDFDGTLNFTNFEIVSITTGPFAGKGFSKGECQTTLGGIPYTGNWQGALFLKPQEGKIYLKGAVSGEISATVEGYLTESVPGSGTYDQYQATWRIGRLGGTTTSVTINLNGTVSYQSSSEFPAAELYVLQSNIEGTISGHYSGPFSTVLTHLRVVEETNPYSGEGFSIISYVSESGIGAGWTYDNLVSPGRVRLKGLFTSPLYGIVSATLDESELPRTLFLNIERVDLGLPPMADLKVKTWGPGRVSPGQTVNYIIEFRNDGLKASDDVIVFNSLDPLVKYISGSPGVYNNDILHYTTWDLGSVPAKTNGYLSAQVEVFWGLPMGTELKNAAYIVEMVPHSSEENLGLNGVGAYMEKDPVTGEYKDGGTANWRQFCKRDDVNAKPEWLYTHEKKVFWPLDGLQDILEVYLVSPYNPTGVPIFTERNGGNVPPGYRPKVLAFSGGTRSAISLIERYIETDGTEGIMTDELILISPFLTSSEELRKLKEKGIKITIYQSPNDDFVPNNLTEGTLSITDSEGRKVTIEVKGNVPGNLVKIKWEEDGNVIYDKDFYIQGDNSKNGDPFESEEGIEVKELNGRHAELIKELETQDQEGKSSSSPSTVAVARDPNIKYGPEGYVQAGQTLDYEVEFENEGEGIAFGVYITDVLDDDLDDLTLSLGGEGTYNPSTRTITWFVGEVGPGEGGSFYFSVNVRGDALVGTDIINFATVYFPSVPEITRTNAIVSIIPPPNRPPIADAGPDQSISGTCPDGAEVTLDGTGSSDPDNDPLTFTWNENSNIIAGPTTDSTATVALAFGTHTIQLTVDDGQGETDTDQVVINVVGPGYASLCGFVIADSTEGLLGINVDVYDSTGALWQSVVTDDSGYYHIDSVPNGDYTVSIMTPLGYQADQETEQFTIYHCPVTVDFQLTKLEIPMAQRGRGYWMHQVNALLSDQGEAQETYQDMCNYMELIRIHFNEHQLNPVNIFSLDLNSDCPQRLEALRDVISPKPNSSMNDKAKAHLTILLLNMVSGKIAQWAFISEDSATVSQAITYCNALIIDGDPENDESAKNIAEMINEGQMVPAGMIDLATADIAYRQETTQQIPTEFGLTQNYPNPFNPTTEISFSLPEASHVKLEIYNVMGQKVTTLVDGQLEAGEHIVQWDGSEAASGVYLYRLEAGEFVDTKKMILLK